MASSFTAVAIAAATDPLQKLNEKQQVRIGEKLIEIALRYKDLLGQIVPSLGDDPEVTRLKSDAKAALDKGDLDRADKLLESVLEAQDEALERQREALERQQAAFEQQQLGAAATAAQRGEMALTRLRYREAAEHFAAAAHRVPPGH